jgi:Spy/CpxP family protein refolding chaperone
MKINKIGLVAALALGGLLAFSNLASAQDAPKGGKKGMPTVQERLDKLTEALTLTDAQKPKVKAVLEEQSKQMQALRDVPQDERRTKGAAMREEYNKKMKEILTAEQYEKFEKLPPPGRGGKKKNAQ